MSQRNKYFIFACKFLIIALFEVSISMASAKPFETFDPQKSRNWSFFTDGVMGGVSSGKAFFGKVAQIILYGLRVTFQQLITADLYK